MQKSLKVSLVNHNGVSHLSDSLWQIMSTSLKRADSDTYLCTTPYRFGRFCDRHTQYLGWAAKKLSTLSTYPCKGNCGDPRSGEIPMKFKIRFHSMKWDSRLPWWWADSWWIFKALDELSFIAAVHENQVQTWNCNRKFCFVEKSPISEILKIRNLPK